MPLVTLVAGCDVVWRIDHVPDGPACLPDDEDCDQQLNERDICPADVDTAADDLDGDGVGNACDPERMMTGDHIALFDGFVDNRLGWSVNGGMWMQADGAFTMTMPADAKAELPVSPPVAMPSVRVVLDDLVTIDNGRAGIIGYDGAAVWTCLVARSTNGEFVRIEGLLAQGGERPLTGTGPIRLQGGQLRNGMLYCRAHHGDDPDVQVVSALSIMTVHLDRLGMITSSASASFKSIMLLDVP
jgi:hypothetical protein